MDYHLGPENAGAEAQIQPKVYTLEQEALDTEFRKEFPPDPQIGSEMADGARVWRVYRKEADAYDNALLEGWTATLDGLLIFAGLFSAVVTAFVIESYQFLQLDNTAYTATALYILVAASNHSTGIALPPPPDLGFSSSASRWINGLFFTSILISLIVAFLSILVKQWITEYRSRNRASAKSPRDWARRREVYSRALERWPVAEIVSFLPVLLHLSLFLFFAGLVAFLWALDQSIGIWIIVLGLTLLVFYLGCTFVPLWVPESPTATPLIRQLRKVSLSLTVASLQAILRLCGLLRRFGAFVRRHVHRALISVEGSIIAVSLSHYVGRTRSVWRRTHRLLSRTRSPGDAQGLPLRQRSGIAQTSIARTWLSCLTRRTATRLERTITILENALRDRSTIGRLVEDQRDKLDAFALTWLIFDVSDSDAGAVGLQALGGIHPAAALADRIRDDNRFACLSDESVYYTRSTAAHSPAEVLRVARSVLSASKDRVIFRERVPSLFAFEDEVYPDIAVLRACDPTESCPLGNAEAQSYCGTSPSLESTAVHALRNAASDRSHYGLYIYLLCCDFTLFSDSDWNFTMKCLACHGSVAAEWVQLALAVPTTCKPLSLAALLKEDFPQKNFWWRDIANRLLWRLILSVDFWLAYDVFKHDRDAFPPLKPSMLDFLTSNDLIRAYEEEQLEGSQKLAQIVALWLCSSAGARHVSPSSRTELLFWRALSHAANAAGSDVRFARIVSSLLRRPLRMKTVVHVVMVCIRQGRRRKQIAPGVRFALKRGQEGPTHPLSADIHPGSAD